MATQQRTQNPREGLSLLQNLLSSPQANKFLDDPAGVIGQAVSQQMKKDTKSSSESFIKGAKPILGAASNLIKGLLDIDAQAQQEQQQQIIENDKRHKAVEQVVINKDKKYAEQALQAGLSPEQVIQMSQQMAIQRAGMQQSMGVGGPIGSQFGMQQPQQSNVNQALTGQAQQPQEQQGPGLLKRMLTGFAEGFQSGAAPNLETQRLQRQEREQGGKLGIELQKIANTPADALNVEQASKFAIITSGQNGLEIAANLLDNNPNLLLTGDLPGFFKSQEGRQFRTAMESAYEGQLRAVSGATLGENEIKKKVKQFGARLTDSRETIRQKFTMLNDFYNTAINTADPTGVHRERAVGNKMSGLDKMIAEEKKRRGIK